MPNPSVILDEKTDSINLVLQEQTLSDLQRVINGYSEDGSSVAISSAISECENFAIDRNTAFTDNGDTSSDTDDGVDAWEADDDLDDDSVEHCSENYASSLDSSDDLPLAELAPFRAHSLNDKNIDIKVEHYYAVYYDDSWYIGRVIEIIDESMSRIKFLKEDLHHFIWPKRDDIQQVQNKYIYYGPIILQGVGPFSLTESVRARTINGFKDIKRKLN